jgi:enoyl-CoA hydratase
MGALDGYSAFETLCLSRVDGVLTLEIDGPSELNLIDGTLHRELSEVWAQIRLDRLTRAVLFTGHGDRAFCAGGQIEWFQSLTSEDKDRAIAEGRRTIVDMLEVPQPIIAAVNGPAVGLGATLALFSDVIVASERAVIADTHVPLGMVAGDGGAIIWPHLIGMHRAKELLLTGDRVRADRAMEIGLVNHVVAHEKVKLFAGSIAQRIAGLPPAAVQGTKMTVNAILRDTVNTVLETSLSLERMTLESDEHRALIDSFRQRAAAR